MPYSTRSVCALARSFRALRRRERPPGPRAVRVLQARHRETLARRTWQPTVSSKVGLHAHVLHARALAVSVLWTASVGCIHVALQRNSAPCSATQRLLEVCSVRTQVLQTGGGARARGQRVACGGAAYTEAQHFCSREPRSKLKHASAARSRREAEGAEPAVH